MTVVVNRQLGPIASPLSVFIKAHACTLWPLANFTVMDLSLHKFPQSEVLVVHLLGKFNHWLRSPGCTVGWGPALGCPTPNSLRTGWSNCCSSIFWIQSQHQMFNPWIFNPKMVLVRLKPTYSIFNQIQWFWIWLVPSFCHENHRCYTCSPGAAQRHERDGWGDGTATDAPKWWLGKTYSGFMEFNRDIPFIYIYI